MWARPEPGGPQIARTKLKRKPTHSCQIGSCHLRPARANLERTLRSSCQINTGGPQKTRTKLERTLSNSYRIGSSYLRLPEPVWNKIYEKVKEGGNPDSANQLGTKTYMFMLNRFVASGTCSNHFGWNELCQVHIKLIRAIWGHSEPV